MRSIGVLDPQRLALLPSKHWTAHEFCFHLHDQLVQLLVQYEASGAHQWVMDAFEKALSDLNAEYVDIDLFLFMKQHGLLQPYKHHLVSHLTLGLTSDMLHFLYESLTCFEKRKFAVGFALLRKPLKENLLFLSWLLADSGDFITRFESNTATKLNSVKPEKRIQILSGAIDRLATKEVFAADLLYDMIYSKTHEKSFEPIWQRATHLITSQGSLLRTEDLNINFIFHDPASDHLYDLLYANLPYLLLYAVQVALECFSQILRANEQTVSHLILSTMGCYESLFSDGAKQHVARLLTKNLRPFLNCLHCDTPLRLTRENAAEMYLKETLTCRKCGLASPFPLYWLLAHGKVKIVREHGATTILEEAR
jgi:hypothetical protein